MVDREVFERRLGKLESLLRDLRSLARESRDDYLGDRAKQAQAERWLHLASECVLDLSHHLIADRGWRQPASYREAIRVLAENGAIDDELCSQLELWAGLRNVLVHLYLDVDHDTIFEIMQTDLDQLESFARAIAQATS